MDLRAVAFRDKEMVVGKDLEKVKVEAKVTGHERGPKIRVFKYKAKKALPQAPGPPFRADPARGHRDQDADAQAGGLRRLGGKKPAAKKETTDGS